MGLSLTPSFWGFHRFNLQHQEPQIVWSWMVHRRQWCRKPKHPPPRICNPSGSGATLILSQKARARFNTLSHYEANYTHTVIYINKKREIFFSLRMFELNLFLVIEAGLFTGRKISCVYYNRWNYYVVRLVFFNPEYHQWLQTWLRSGVFLFV